MNGFGPLALEALLDAVRRRIVLAVVVVCVLSVMVLDSCTACSTQQVLVNGEPRSLAEVGGAMGLVTVTVLGLWVVALAGVLAADHLRETLDDGSAQLCLARPVARGTFALARLAGALAIALATGAVLLGAAGFLLASRASLPATPALLAGAACALACVAVGALAMAASLFLPRLPTVLLVFVGVGLVTLANGLGMVQQGGATGLLGALDRTGPPLASSLVAALAPWVGHLELSQAPGLVAARAALWAVAGLVVLLVAFQRVEIRD